MVADLRKSLKREPRSWHWLIRHGVSREDLPDEAVMARTWDDGWRVVWYIPPQRVSARWARILEKISDIED